MTSAKRALPLLVLSLLLALTACAGTAAARRDVTMTSCGKSSVNHPAAGGQITNHSSKDSLYTIHVTFQDAAGNNIANGYAVVHKVAPGASAIWRAAGPEAATGGVRCVLSSVARNATPQL